ncbi:MAG TPA: CoA ester lyase [Aggregatilineales bacterium]|nr:CoA ester lyase [Anaerolineales bacterium]HRE49003.1 CoA ester lyase [Aggregatilineales bacterium]
MTERQITNRVRRALLFTPGDDLKKIQKGATLGADSLILDMEDGVALNRKQAARATIHEAFRTVNFGWGERLVRINPLDSPFGRDDLLSVLPFNPDGIIIPKVDSADDVREVSLLIRQHEKYSGIAVGTIRILVFVETALGIVNLKEIAASDSRLDGLMFGAEDYVGSIGAARTKAGWEVFYARSAVVAHAAAYDLQAIDTIFADLNDMDALTEDCRLAAGMGYSGKLAIHPKQIAPILSAFTPSAEEVAKAQRLVDAFHANQEAGAGVFALDGKMVDMPMLRAAERVLARAQTGETGE